jgi:hypothetical protein
MAVRLVSLAADRLRDRGFATCSSSELFTVANDVAWDQGLMLSQADLWEAVYEWCEMTNGNNSGSTRWSGENGF